MSGPVVPSRGTANVSVVPVRVDRRVDGRERVADLHLRPLTEPVALDDDRRSRAEVAWRQAEPGGRGRRARRALQIEHDRPVWCSGSVRPHDHGARQRRACRGAREVHGGVGVEPSAWRDRRRRDASAYPARQRLEAEADRPGEGTVAGDDERRVDRRAVGQRDAFVPAGACRSKLLATRSRNGKERCPGATLAFDCGSAVKPAWAGNPVIGGAFAVALRCSVAVSCVPGTGLGSNVPVTPSGRPDRFSATGPLDPLTRVIVIGTSVVPPCCTAATADDADSEMSGSEPVGIRHGEVVEAERRPLRARSRGDERTARDVPRRAGHRRQLS